MDCQINMASSPLVTLIFEFIPVYFGVCFTVLSNKSPRHFQAFRKFFFNIQRIFMVRNLTQCYAIPWCRRKTSNGLKGRRSNFELPRQEVWWLRLNKQNSFSPLLGNSGLEILMSIIPWQRTPRRFWTLNMISGYEVHSLVALLSQDISDTSFLTQHSFPAPTYTSSQKRSSYLDARPLYLARYVTSFSL